jgi:hypothetical protein
MTIEIHSAEIEEIIQQRLASGGFRDAEDVVAQALRKTVPAGKGPREKTGFSGAELIAAMQACPHPDFEMEHPKVYADVREIELP